MTKKKISSNDYFILLKMSFELNLSNGKDAVALSDNIKLSIAALVFSDVLPEQNKDATYPLFNPKTNFNLFHFNTIVQYLKAVKINNESAFAPFEIKNEFEKADDSDISQIISFADNYKKLIKSPNTWFTAFSKLFKVNKAVNFALGNTKQERPKLENTNQVKILPNHEIIKPEGKIVPKDGERNILITSALPYVNNVPHLGNIVGSVLSADIYARFCKNRNYNTLFICGTDEYGTATETKALEEGVTPRELCTKYHKIHKDVYDWFQIGFDHFGRTTTEKQTEIAQGIFTKLYENGFLEQQTMRQLYCPEHNGYLADRYVEGECPKCHYEDARGDQCDKCGSLLDSFELINPRCKLDNATPIPKNSEHIFLSLDKLQPELQEWVEKQSVEGYWTKNARTITNSWLKEGLRPRCITRDLVWGTPVPLEGFSDKVLYVWFDATIGYISITATYSDDWKKWWKSAEDDVQLYQFMGKDNVPFHTVVFPASEIGTKEPWTRLHHVSATEYLQYEGGKFSKSRGVGVFGNNAKETGVSASVWRYYLASVRPENQDSQFSWTEFVTKNNSELLANLGNFVNRIVKYVNAKYNGVVPAFKVENCPNWVNGAHGDFETLLKTYLEDMESTHLRKGLETAMLLSSRGNQFLQDNKLDNSLYENEPDRADAVVGLGLNIVYLLSSIIGPYMPEVQSDINKILNAPSLRIPDTVEQWIQGGHCIGQAKYLFSRIDEKSIEEWRAKYGGQQKK